MRREAAHAGVSLAALIGIIVLGVLGALALAALAIPAAVGALFADRDGDQVARSSAELSVAGLEEYFFSGVNEVRPAEELVATVPEGWGEPYGEPGISRIYEPLAWMGKTGGDDGERAVIDVRITVEVEAYRPPGMFARARTAGDARVCYRVTASMWEVESADEIDCPNIPIPPRPVIAAPPQFPTDVDARLAAIVGAPDASIDTVADAIRAALVDIPVTVETEPWQGGFVVAVGVSGELSCRVAVRDAQGTVSFASFDQVSLQPGELGCSTRLATSPPL